MKNSIVLKSFLIVSGLLLAFIGGSTLFIPVQMKANAGIDIANNINVVNDVRAYSGLLLGVAILALLGAFSKRLTYTSTLIASLLFITLGLGRILSILLDGIPVEGLVKATALEMVLGITGIVLFNLYQDKKALI